jgi:hypothetical protein
MAYKNVVYIMVADGRCVAHAKSARELGKAVGTKPETILTAIARSKGSKWKRVSVEEYFDKWDEEVRRERLRKLRYCDRCSAVLPDPQNYARVTVKFDPNERTYKLCPSCYKTTISFVEGDIGDDLGGVDRDPKGYAKKRRG